MVFIFTCKIDLAGGEKIFTSNNKRHAAYCGRLQLSGLAAQERAIE